MGKPDQQGLAQDERPSRNHHEPSPGPREQLDLMESRVPEQAGQFGKRILLEVEARGHRIEIHGNIPGSAHPVRGDANIAPALGERGVDVLQLLDGVFRMEMLDEVGAVGQGHASPGHRDAGRVGDGQAEIPRRIQGLGDFIGHVHGIDLLHAFGRFQGQRTISGADLQESGFTMQETADDLHLVGHHPALLLRRGFARHLRMMGDMPEKLVVEPGIQRAALFPRGIEQSLRQFFFE
jgi:hypothetical protein